MEAFS